jgi:septum formation protein
MIASEITYVTMRTMTDAEIDGYVQSGEWRGKAGSYAIQETGDRFVTNVEGSFSNVVGLPMELVARMLNAFDTRTDGV